MDIECVSMSITKSEYVIFTALVGKYDEIKQPLVVDGRFDYILFSNDIKEPRVGVWQIKPILFHNEDNTRVCRYVKTHPDELLSAYKFSIWMDASMQICTSFVYERAIELSNSKIQISSMWHPIRKCIYEEAFAVMHGMVEHESVVVKWCHKLRRENYPQDNGLCETGFLYRKHTTLVQQFNKIWWNCINKYSRRDQLSFNYVLWKLGIPCHYFWGEGKNVRNTEHIQLVMHQNLRHNYCPINKNEAWLMRYCWKNKEKTNEIKELYYRLYSYPFPKLFIAIAGQIYRIKYLLENHD